MKHPHLKAETHLHHTCGKPSYNTANTALSSRQVGSEEVGDRGIHKQQSLRSFGKGKTTRDPAPKLMPANFAGFLKDVLRGALYRGML